jgi:hypothetical protein
MDRIGFYLANRFALPWRRFGTTSPPPPLQLNPLASLGNLASGAGVSVTPNVAPTAGGAIVTIAGATLLPGDVQDIDGTGGAFSAADRSSRKYKIDLPGRSLTVCLKFPLAQCRVTASTRRKRHHVLCLQGYLRSALFS